MSHYVLDVSLKEKMRNQVVEFYHKLEFDSMVYNLKHSRASNTITFETKAQAELMAATYSKVSCVDKIVITHIAETSCGVWRGGKKS